MANWKKVIVSGSNAELNHITASGDITASGHIFASMSYEPELQWFVVWNETNGRLERRQLDLVSSFVAPPLFLADLGPYNGDDGVNNGQSDADFRPSYDTGSFTIPSNARPYIVLSASKDGGSTYNVAATHSVSPGQGTVIGGNQLGDEYNWVGLNDHWKNDHIGNTSEMYNLAQGEGGEYNGIQYSLLHTVRNGLILGTSKKDINIALQGYGYNAQVPAYPPVFGAVLTSNYSASAFRDGGIGDLEIYFNDNATPAHSIDLSANLDEYTETPYTNGVRFTVLHATQSNSSNAGDLVTQPGKHFRSGSIDIQASSQKDGYNFAYIIHTGSNDDGDFCYITNFVEWFYDIEGAGQALSIPNQTVNISSDNFDNNAAGIDYVSGIKFYNQNSYAKPIEYIITCSNHYRNVYPVSEGITFSGISTNTIDEIQVTQSGQYQVPNYQDTSGAPGPTEVFNMAKLDYGANATANVRETDNEISASIPFSFEAEVFHQPGDFTDNQDSSFGYVPWGPLSGIADITWTTTFSSISNVVDSVTVYHKSNISGAPVNEDDFLVNTLTSNATEYNFEDFKRESFRIIKNAYTSINTTSPTGSTYAWDETQDLSGAPPTGYENALIQWKTDLIQPLATGDDGLNNQGNYTTTLGPTNQPDYTGLTGEREYYRYFALGNNQSGGAAMNLEFVGNARICPESNTTDFTTGGIGIKVYVNRTARNNTGGPFNEQFVNVLDNGICTYTGGFESDQYVPVGSEASYLSSDSVDVTTTQPGGLTKTVQPGICPFQDAGKDFDLDDVLLVKIVIPDGGQASIDAIGLTKNIQSNNTNRVLGTIENSSDF